MPWPFIVQTQCFSVAPVLDLAQEQMQTRVEVMLHCQQLHFLIVEWFTLVH